MLDVRYLARRIAIRLSVALLLTSMTCPSAHSDGESGAAAQNVPTPLAVFSLAQSTLITNLAVSRPCAALALLYIRLQYPTTKAGTFYLEELPSAQAIAFIFSQDAPDSIYLPMQPNLYSDSRVFVAIRWTNENLGDARAIVTTTAQLVDAAGVPIEPAHSVERPTRMLLSHETLRFLAPADDL